MKPAAVKNARSRVVLVQTTRKEEARPRHLQRRSGAEHSRCISSAAELMVVTWTIGCGRNASHKKDNRFLPMARLGRLILGGKMKY